MTVDLSADYLIFDGTEAASLTQAGTGDVASIADALRRSVTATEAAASAGKYTSSDVRWHLPAVQCSFAPKPADYIVAGAETFRVLAVELATLRTRYACTCRLLAIENRLQDFVSVELGVATSSPMGTPQYRWERTYVNEAAAVFEASEDEQLRPAGDKLQPTHVVYFSRAIEIDARYRIVHDGTIYRVIGARDAQAIDAFFAVDVRKQEVNS